MNEWICSEILRIVTDCEAVQNEHGSSFSKEMAKVNAYNEIREVLGDLIKVEVEEWES